MKRSAIALVFMLATATTALSAAVVGPAPALPAPDRIFVVSDTDDAMAVIEGVYAAYNAGDYADQQEKTFTPDLFRAYMAVQEGAGEDVELAIDFDVFLNAQDEDKVTIEAIDFDQSGPLDGTVTARISLFGEAPTFVYTMKKTAAGWRIDDIAWGEGQETLRELIAFHAAEQKKRL